MTPSEPGFYFYSENSQRILVKVSNTAGKNGHCDGPLLAIEFCQGVKPLINYVKSMEGQWSQKIKFSGPDILKDPEAQKIYERVLIKKS